MTKIYTIEGVQELPNEEDLRIKVTETKDIESFTSVKDLKMELQRCSEELNFQKTRYNNLVDELTAIDADAGIDITVSDIPAKLK